MIEHHWAIFALRDIQSALHDDKYNAASDIINDAVEAILAHDAKPDVANCAHGNLCQERHG